MGLQDELRTYVVDDHRRTFTLTPHGAADPQLTGPRSSGTP